MAKLDIYEGAVLTVANRHVKGCGKPPELVAGGKYVAYFENQYGEQLVFTYDWRKKEGKLWHGDCGWDQPIDVYGGRTIGTILSKEEGAWLQLVWETATKEPVSAEFLEGSGNGSKSYYDIHGFTNWGILVPLRVPKEQVVRMLAALMSTDLGMTGVDSTLRKWRASIEESVSKTVVDEGD